MKLEAGDRDRPLARRDTQGVGQVARVWPERMSDAPPMPRATASRA
eukprot:CAMPEP_0183361400 /NCGR_PEP_ID=MMETSP0164_2-20130417/60231_1 /TAXON_ID=221442 /ORGANISM="Coccolithus pelagicus ssp braarudi, Strain PLY182g" /LENGTH=45 /DNA_ID= /DNA_START= /DNA_END= /DNA_ORIENTATION=